MIYKYYKSIKVDKDFKDYYFELRLNYTPELRMGLSSTFDATERDDISFYFDFSIFGFGFTLHFGKYHDGGDEYDNCGDYCF